MPCRGCHFIEDTLGIHCHCDKTLHQLLCKFWRPGEGSGIQQRVGLWHSTFNEAEKSPSWQLQLRQGSSISGEMLEQSRRVLQTPGRQSVKFTLWPWQEVGKGRALCQGPDRWSPSDLSLKCLILQGAHSLFHDPREEAEVLNQHGFLSSQQSILSRELFSETLGGTWGGCILVGQDLEPTLNPLLCRSYVAQFFFLIICLYFFFSNFTSFPHSVSSLLPLLSLCQPSPQRWSPCLSSPLFHRR